MRVDTAIVDEGEDTVNMLDSLTASTITCEELEVSFLFTLAILLLFMLLLLLFFNGPQAQPPHPLSYHVCI